MHYERGSIMNRTTLLAALVLTAIIATASPVLATRDPGPDPGPARSSGMALYNYRPKAPTPPRIGQSGLNNQYADGMNLYQYVASNPLHKFDLGMVAVVLGDLPKDVTPSVLWALTYLLNEQGKGRWSEDTGALFLKRHSEHSSPPIRQLARKFLKGRLGVDHEWDASAWRAAITKRKTNNNRDKIDAKSKVETQPAKAE